MLNSEQITASFDFDAATIAQLRAQWCQLIDIAVWGDLRIAKLGALPRLRKRLLEVGENLQSLFASRAWIPQPREQLKSALGTSVKLRDSLLDLERTAVALEVSPGMTEFEPLLLSFRQCILALVERHEALWAGMLDSLYTDEDDSPI